MKDNSTTKDLRSKVLKMYCAEYKKLDSDDEHQLKEILKQIHHSLVHHAERNYIFWGSIRANVIPILVTNGFRPTTLHVVDAHLNIPIIAWSSPNFG